MSKDIIVFTLHKSASMFIHEQCEKLTKLCGISYYSPNNPTMGMDAFQILTNKKIWLNKSGCFGPIRFFVEVPNIEDYAIILHLRDPRDVLVSMFYSYCFIHPGKVQPNTSYRKAIAENGIDQFVLNKATNYPIWIEKFIEPFPLIDKRSVIKRFVSDYQHEFVILGEDRLQHKRHVIPGDFRIKLKEKIIIELNNLFRDVLSVLGYDE